MSRRFTTLCLAVWILAVGHTSPIRPEIADVETPKPWIEGRGGIAGRAAQGTLPVRYRFSGVTDDGAQGSGTRKVATSIHCTNFGATTADVEVQLYLWNGVDVYVGMLPMGPGTTSTFSTQDTTIYFDDVVVGGGSGTPVINQGSGLIRSASKEVRCTAQVLDPLGYPPAFVSRLPLFTATLFADGFESGNTSRWSTTVP